MAIGSNSSGARPPVLFLHGGGVSKWMWNPTLDALKGAVDPIVPDLPGHGERHGTDYTSHASAVEELATLIRNTAPSGVFVVGFSLGGQLALRLMSEHPERVRGAIIISAAAAPTPLVRTTLALVRWSAPLARQRWFARLQSKQLRIPETLREAYLRDSRQISRATLISSIGENLRFTLPPALSSFRSPAVVVVGARERRLMLVSAHTIHRALPKSSIRVVPHALHDIPFRQPQVLADLILDTAGITDALEG